MSISRNAARQLFNERREAETLKAEKRAEAELQAVERDRRWRASLPSGVPAGAIPQGMRPAEALFAAELDSYGYQPRRTSVAEDLLSNDGITFHPIQHGADES